MSFFNAATHIAQERIEARRLCAQWLANNPGNLPFIQLLVRFLELHQLNMPVDKMVAYSDISQQLQQLAYDAYPQLRGEQHEP